MTFTPTISAINLVKPALITRENTSLKELFQLTQTNLSSHIIVTKNEELVGIISNEDLLRKMVNIATSSSGKIYSDIQLENVKAKDIMTKTVVKVHQEMEWQDVLKTFKSHSFHCLPVVDDDNHPIGVITPLELMLHYIAHN
jgi:acetoin utilization protein AcuB